jgi:uncharacterized glyoxalase superfamily protein PhnB
MAVKSLFPILRTRDLERLRRFYTDAFGARVSYRYEQDGIEVYVAFEIGGGSLALGWDPEVDRGESIALWLYVDDIDAAYRRAVTAGADSVDAPAAMPWGEMVAQVRDPDGNALYLGVPSPG